MSLDLTNISHLDEIYHLADEFLANTHADESTLESIETSKRSDPETPLRQLVALKLARSKSIILQQFSREKPIHVSVIFAVYKEHQRILSSTEHPYGEDFLNRKIHQLQWLFEDAQHITWELLIVDDGCPEQSGQIAQSIIKQYQHEENARVLFLQEAIEKQNPVTSSLTSTSDSQKGGAILYGMWEACQKQLEDHIEHFILYTDADLSTHLGQTGLLLKPFLDPKVQASIGSRRNPESVVVKQGTRNSRGKLFIYLWKRMLPILNGIIDTQCAFKAFRADLAHDIILDAIEHKFAFDIELLLKTELHTPDCTQVVPIAWIDSEAASTTTELEPYLAMLQSIVAMYRKYLPPKDQAEPFANLIESLSHESWHQLCENAPPSIAESDPSDLGKEIISAEDLLTG